jgi:hypothetical protein
MDWVLPISLLFALGIVGFILGVMNSIRLNKIEENLKKDK